MGLGTTGTWLKRKLEEADAEMAEIRAESPTYDNEHDVPRVTEAIVADLLRGERAKYRVKGLTYLWTSRGKLKFGATTPGATAIPISGYSSFVGADMVVHPDELTKAINDRIRERWADGA